MKNVVLITGASSGFGLLTARALARAGHTVYASMRDTSTRNAPRVAEIAAEAKAQSIDLRTVELDVGNQASVDAAVSTVLAETGRIDVVIHNAGHMVFGPAESFTPEQLAALYDVNVLSTQRVNRAVLPHLRERGEGLVLWVSSSSARGGVPPYLAPFGIETSIIVPGAFTKGTNHFAHSGQPADEAVAKAYTDGPYADIPDKILHGLAALEPADADAATVAEAIVAVVDAPRGKRPYRVHVDPSQDGAEIVFAMGDRVRAELLRRIGLEDLLAAKLAG
jgi:nucleoside-diphosphate-sugar epimerase